PARPCWRSPAACAWRLPDRHRGAVGRICSSHMLRSDVFSDACVVDFSAAVALRSAARHLSRQSAATFPHPVFPGEKGLSPAPFVESALGDLKQEDFPISLKAGARRLKRCRGAVPMLSRM